MGHHRVLTWTFVTGLIFEAKDKHFSSLTRPQFSPSNRKWYLEQQCQLELVEPGSSVVHVLHEKKGRMSHCLDIWKKKMSLEEIKSAFT